MKKFMVAALAAIALNACSTTADPELVASDYGSNLQPIQGSITYRGQPKSRLTKSPAGSTFEHQFTNRYGNPTIERYRINQDRSLEIISRRVVRLPDD